MTHDAGPSPPPFFVLTGGPGAGKTTLVEALAQAGVATVAEAGRAVIRDVARRPGAAVARPARLRRRHAGARRRGL